MEVPTICKAYFSGLCKGIYTQNMDLYGTVPPSGDAGIPITRAYGGMSTVGVNAGRVKGIRSY